MTWREVGQPVPLFGILGIIFLIGWTFLPPPVLQIAIVMSAILGYQWAKSF